MRKIIFTLLVLGAAFSSSAQYRVNAGASLGAGASLISLGVEREFNVVSEKFHINPGVRFGVFSGSDLDYITAPAEYTTNDDQVDTVNFGSAQNNFANIYVRLGYDITEKLSVSFDIDVVGVSFGGEQKDLVIQPGTAQAAYFENNPLIDSKTKSAANPTSFNALLVGDNDLGSLNSTLSLSYDITSRLGLDLGVGLVFTEYTTDITFGYDGNDRFRNKNMMGYLGVSYLLGNK